MRSRKLGEGRGELVRRGRAEGAWLNTPIVLVTGGRRGEGKHPLVYPSREQGKGQGRESEGGKR